jgi:hypothetical protein
MPGASAVALPRPNPGPEPPPRPGPLGPALTLLVAAAWIAAGAWWSFRRRGDRTGSIPRIGLPVEPAMSELAEAVRGALVVRFGPSWLARTTEEIAGAPEIAAAFGPEDAASLARFLRDADRAKFGAAADQGAAWAAWVAGFLSAGASSTITGK